MRPAIVMKWPGTVPIFPKCELCDGQGHKVHNAGTRRLVSADGSIVCTALTGSIVWCYRCNGSGCITRYGIRGGSFTPLVARRISIWERIRG